MESALTFVGLFAILAAGLGVAEVNRHKMITFYGDVGCVPVGSSKYYDCSAVVNVNAPGQCVFRGVRYNPGDFLTRTVGSINPCRFDCVCTGRENSQDTGYFSCPEVDCAFRQLPGPDCRHVYSDIDSCCADGVLCGSNNLTCTYKSNTYQQGEIFHPDSQPCLKCLCGGQSNTKLKDRYQRSSSVILQGSFCRTVSCSVQLERTFNDEINRYCAPVFRQGLCCPTEFYCQTGTEELFVANQEDRFAQTGCHPVSDESEQCRFGDMHVNLGEVIKAREKSLKCECLIPPFLSCWSE